MPPARSRRSGRQFRQKRLLLVIAVLLGACVAVYAGHQFQLTRQAPALLERGRSATAEKSWKAAISAYTQYLRLRPRDAAAHAERADAYLAAAQAERNDPSLAARYSRDALQGYLDAIAHDGDRADVRRKLADLHHSSARWAANERALGRPGPGMEAAARSARDQLTRLIGPSDKTTDATLLLMLADCDLWEKKPDDERKRLEALVVLPDAPPIASRRLADRIREADKSPQGIATADAVMNKVVSDHKTDLDVRLMRADYRRKFGDKSGAKADLEFAYANIPDGKASLRVIGEYVQILRADGELVTAEKVLRTARAALPADNGVALKLAEVLFQSGMAEKAKEGDEIIRAVSAILPDGDRQLLKLGDTLLDHGDTAAVRAAADRLAKTPANRTLARYLTGRLAILSGDWPSARADLTAALPDLPKTSPDNVVTAKAHYWLAVAHAAAQDPAAQLAAARAAIVIAPTWTDAKLMEADALTKTDKRADAAALLRNMMSATPAARTALARLLLADVIAQPSSDSTFRDFVSVIGSPPYPPDLGFVALQARVARGDPKVAADLEADLKKTPDAPVLWLALIGYQAIRDPAAARDAVEKAIVAVGDRADLRLARGTLIARDPKTTTPAELMKLAENADKFTADERANLHRGLATLLAARGFRAEAIQQTRAAVALRPFDLGARLVLFDYGLLANDADAIASALAEIRKLDGADGALAKVAEVSRAMAGTPAPTAVQLDEWRTQLAAAIAVRDSWSRPHALLGDLARRDKRLDEALDHYMKAIDRGGAGDAVVQTAVQLLLAQQKYDAAMRLMADLDRSGGLTPALRAQYQLRRASSGGDPTAALQTVRSPEMENSDNYRDHLDRSFVFMLHNQQKEAKAALDKALARNNTAPDVWLARVRYLVVVSPTDAPLEAERAIQKLLGSPNTADPLATQLAVARLRELVGQFDKAITEYQAAAKAAPTDRRPVEMLHGLYRRTAKLKDADALLKSLTEKDDAVGRWARRQTALLLVNGPDGYREIPEAVRLIDRNMANGGNDVEDVRAKAFVQAADPFQRTEALSTLSASLARGAMTALETLNFARMRAQAGQPDEAERLLVASTSGGAIPFFDHLALLARLQTERGARIDAGRTIDRLKLLDPFGWDTAVETARLQAKDDKPAAAKTLLAHRVAEKPELRVSVIARLLEEFKCPAEAKAIYEKWNETETRKDRHLPLVQFLIRQKQGEAALKLTLERAADVPVGFTARLIAGAIRSRHPDTVPLAEREAWQKKATEGVQWVKDQADKEPNNVDFIIARAELADADGKYAEAARLYGLAAEHTDNSDLKAGMRNNRAWLLAMTKAGTAEEPLRLMNETIGARGPLPFYLDTRAMVRVSAGQHQDALADLDVAVAVDAKPTYHFHRAVAFDRLGKADAAKVAAEEAVKRGLSRDDLHPLEWPDFDRLIGKK